MSTESDNTNFPYSLKYINNASKVIFGKETETDILNLLESLIIFTGADDL